MRRYRSPLRLAVRKAIGWSILHGWACMDCHLARRYCQHFPVEWKRRALVRAQPVSMPGTMAARRTSDSQWMNNTLRDRRNDHVKRYVPV